MKDHREALRALSKQMEQTNSIQWLERRTVLFAHDAQLAEHGGLRGFRGEGLFDSALVRPR